jgi:hypothetical protein
MEDGQGDIFLVGMSHDRHFADRVGIRGAYNRGHSEALQRDLNEAVFDMHRLKRLPDALKQICTTEVARESSNVQASSVQCPAALLGDRQGESFDLVWNIGVRLSES